MPENKFMSWLFGKTISKLLSEREHKNLYNIYLESKSAYPFHQWEFVWRNAAKLLGVDPAKLLPADRLCVELSNQPGLLGVNTELESLFEWLQYELELVGEKYILSEFITLNDIVERVLFSCQTGRSSQTNK